MDHIETKTTNAERKQTQTGAEDGMGRVLIKGSGDLASGIALRLHRAGFRGGDRPPATGQEQGQGEERCQKGSSFHGNTSF